jgi:hypothetical protein
VKNKIRNIIREEIKKIFEISNFQTAAAEQLATNMALYKLPRKGIDDSINNFQELQYQIDKIKQPDQEHEEELENNFKSPSANYPSASVRTNIYEKKEVEEGYGMYGSTEAAKKNLDWERLKEPVKGAFSQEAQDEFDLHNNNIKRSLEEIPPGNSREKGIKNNKFQSR